MSLDRLRRDESGVALVAAMLAFVIVSGLVVLFVARSINEQSFARGSRDSEGAIHAAEAGADALIGVLNLEKDSAPVITPVDAATKHTYDPANKPADEEQWAIDLALADAGNLVPTEHGFGYAIRPVDPSGAPVNTVWAVGFVPDTTSPDRRVRVVKMQIDRDRFVPYGALQTDGNLDLGGNAAIKDPNCDTSDPNADCSADVLVNGKFTKSAGSSYEVQGDIRVAGGECPDSTSTTGGECYGASAGVEPYPVPEVMARDFYGRNCSDPSDLNPDPSGQPVACFDLCPNGGVYPPSAAGPCDTTQAAIWPDGTSTNFRGWEWVPSQMTWKATKVGAGVFYVYHADADLNGSDGTRAVTIFVEGDPANPSQTGALDIAGNPQLTSAFPDVQFVADRDIKMKGNAAGDAGSFAGFISVYEQLDVSGTVSLVGALVVQDAEDLHGLVTRNTDGLNGTMLLTYDETLTIDIDGLYTITYWNEI